MGPPKGNERNRRESRFLQKLLERSHPRKIAKVHGGDSQKGEKERDIRRSSLWRKHAYEKARTKTGYGKKDGKGTELRGFFTS